MPWCIPCNCPNIVKYILLDCIDPRDTKIRYYRNVDTMQKLFSENIFNIINYLKECDLFKKFSLIYFVLCNYLIIYSVLSSLVLYCDVYSLYFVFFM